MESIDPEELEKFKHVGEWDEDGSMRLLHSINAVRLNYIVNLSGRPQSVLDVGCGGGLLSLPLGKLGWEVLGIDPSRSNIAAALIRKRRAVQLEKLKSGQTYSNVSYQATTALGDKKQYDVVLSMEVVEHVANVENFVRSCWKLVKPQGLFFISSINRSFKAGFQAIFLAERILGFLPIGTHNYRKLVKPSEILEAISGDEILSASQQHKLIDISSISYDWYSAMKRNLVLGKAQVDNGTWHLGKVKSPINYIMCIKKL